MNNVLNSFYDYQKKAFDATQQNQKGIVCMPTGTGKTRIQAGVIANDIIENPGFRMYVVNAPRIMLSLQLMREVQLFLLENKIEARYMAVHSGRVEDDEEVLQFQYLNKTYSEVSSTTSPTAIREMITTAHQQDLPLIFFSTYNSAERIEEGRRYLRVPQINITLNDEAHYLVQERFYDVVDTLKSDRKYFFTATTRESASPEGRGMNNVDTYGENIFTMSPREAIDGGAMVRPRLHIVTGRNGEQYTENDVDTSLGKLVIESFKQHEYAMDTGTDAAKMLIASRGTEDVRKIINSEEIQRAIQSGVDVFAVVSNAEIGNWVNGEKMNRNDFLTRLREVGNDNTKRMIIIHYDILTEGIDVPGITAVMPMRKMSKAKFIQTFGRAARLDPDDRRRFATGEIQPHELNKMDKPFAYVILPLLTTSNNDIEAHTRSIITELRQEFDWDPTDDTLITDTERGIRVKEGAKAITDVNTRAANFGEMIDEVVADIECARIASLSKEDALEELLVL